MTTTPLPAESLLRHRWHIFPRVHNLRDLGGIRLGGPTGAGPATRWGHTFRSDGLHRNTEGAGAQADIHQWRLVIDLRTCAEAARDGRFDDHHRIRYEHVPLMDDVWDWEEEFSGDTVRFLSGKYLSVLEDRPEGIRRVVQLLAAETGPAVFHCTAGKDRTGIVAALLLALAGAADGDIAEDYARSASAVLRLMDDHHSDPGSDTDRGTGRGADAEAELLARPHRSQRSADSATMHAFLRGVRERWGSVERYLRRSGVGADEVAAVRDRMR